MAEESGKRESNPIAEGAQQIRSIVGNTVRDGLKDVFPTRFDWQYGPGGHNLIFVVMSGHGEQGGGFFRNGDLLVLSPDGELRTGQVKRTVSNWWSRWDVRSAQLQKASDITVVKYAPRLVLKLIKQIDTEVVDQSDPDKIRQSLDFVLSGLTMYTQIAALSKNALVEMGGEGEIPPEELDFGGRFFKEFGSMLPSLPDHKPSGNFEKKRAAFALYERGGQILAEISQLCTNMRAVPVEEWFAKLIAGLNENGLFQNITNNTNRQYIYVDPDGIVWYRPVYYPHEMIRPSCSPDESWAWAISTTGEVREMQVFKTEPVKRRCPEDLLKQGPEIAIRLIGGVIREIFPKLELMHARSTT